MSVERASVSRPGPWRPPARLLAVAVLWAGPGAGLTGCTFFDGNSRVLVTSEPPGAEVLLDGEPTGLTTPANVQLGAIFGRDHRITLRKRGFSPEHRDVTQWTHGYTSRWVDGATIPELISIPLFWSWGDFLTPFAVRWQYVPQELYVQLYRLGEAPVDSEALTADAGAGAPGTGPDEPTPAGADSSRPARPLARTGH